MFEPEGSSKFDQIDFAYRAGATIEIISKGVLALEHPALAFDLSKNNALTGLLRGSMHHEEASNHRARTSLSASMALGAACSLRAIESPELAQKILQERNAAVHLGIAPVDCETLRDRLITWLSQLAASGPGISAELVEELASGVHALRERVSHKIGEAARRVRAEARRSTNDIDDPGIDRIEKVECPACNRAAELSARIIDVETVWISGSYTYDISYEIDLNCPFCDLELSDAEIEAGKIELRAVDHTSVPEES